MYADCPHCGTEFHISAKHLSVAGGKVRCGSCNNIFNAIEHLHDEPIVKIASTEAIDADTNEQEPEFDIPVEFDVDQTDTESLAAADRTEPPPDFEEPVFESEMEINEEIQYSFTDNFEKDRPKGNRFLAFFWVSGTLALLIIAASQLLWFNRDRVLQYYPQAIPQAKRFCEQFHCELIRKQDLSAIEMVNRDVRLHPLFVETLLVNATIINLLSVAQPYPTVQINLFDTGGIVIGSRKFTPEEYLDQSIAIYAGMSPNNPIHFVLEITGYTSDAVSFEFRFL